MSRSSAPLPISRALVYIFLSTLLISGTATLLWLYSERVKFMGSRDERYTITGIVQTGPRRGQLPSDYLIEQIGLSVDKPQNLFRFDVAEAEEKLLQSPFIYAARVTKVKPGALAVDYTIRTPIARLAREPRTGIDREGRQFPLDSFYAMENLPKVQVSEGQVSLLLELLGLLPDAKQIDLSRLALPDYGRREIVIQSAEGKYLRLHPKNYREGLHRYRALETTDLLNVGAICDLRVRGIALLS